MNLYDNKEREAEHEDSTDNQDPKKEVGDDMDVEEPNTGFKPNWIASVDR